MIDQEKLRREFLILTSSQTSVAQSTKSDRVMINRFAHGMNVSQNLAGKIQEWVDEQKNKLK